MTHHSSVDLESTDAAEATVPLAERPLVANDQNTVITSGLDSDFEADPNLPLSATAQEIRDRLFAPPDDEHKPERGLRIGHFEVEERIGSGGMGAVFRAVDLELSRYVALKVLHPSIAADPSLVARFRNEARSCAQLNHDNLARVFYSGEQDGVHYIAYEFADGLTIKELIAERGVLTPQETVNYAIQATLALSHVDAAGIVHRDIKPSNIILTNQGRVKVVDLGLARRETTDSIGDLTVAGAMLGTFDYIAPEQARDPRTADIRSDIYSLGCTVYHMLTGQPPYPEGTAMQKLLDHQGKAPPDPRLLATDVPPVLSAIVQDMMNTDPDKRYQDPGQLLADLLSLATELGLKSVPAEGIVWRRMAVTRVRELSGALFLTGAVVALCVTALIMHFTPTNMPESADDVQAVLPGYPSSDDSEDIRKGSGSNSNVNMIPEAEESGGGKTIAESNAASGSGDSVGLLTSPFRIVRANGAETEHESLSAALSAAHTGDEILLDFDGALPTPTTPLFRLDPSAIRSITLRAAEGCDPIIDFVGETNASRSDQNQMFYLSNNLSLSIVGVDLRVSVPADASDEWAFFRCVGANQLRLKDCTLEVSNPSRRDAAVVRLTDTPSGETDPSGVSVTFDNVAVRGTSDVFHIAGHFFGDLTATQSAFAVDGSLIRNFGSQREPGRSQQETPQITLTLNHVTTVLSEPMIVMRDSDGLTGGEQERDLPKINVIAGSSLFASLADGGTLIQSRGNAYLTDMHQMLTWNGSRNLYHQIRMYWDLSSGSLDDDSDQMEFPDWLVHWENSEGGSEQNSDEIVEPPWLTFDAFTGTTRSELVKVSRADFELNRALFFGAEATQYKVDRSGALPGVDTRDLRQFPPPELLPVPEPNGASITEVEPEAVEPDEE